MGSRHGVQIELDVNVGIFGLSGVWRQDLTAALRLPQLNPIKTASGIIRFAGRLGLDVVGGVS